MPSISTTSSSVFGRFKRQPTEIVTSQLPPPATTITAPPDAIHGETSPAKKSPQSELDRGHLLRGHKRESSILSLSSSVNDVRRSISLRSHRSQPSSVSSGHKSRLSSAHLPAPSSLSPSPIEDSQPQLQSHRTRNKLSVSTSAPQQTKSTEYLPNLRQPLLEEPPPDPPLTAVDPPTRNPFSMLASGPNTFKRHATDRPSLGTQASFPPGTGVQGPNGATLQAAPPIQPAGGHNPNAIYQQIRETAAKRIATIDYLKRVYEGDVYYFSTLHFTQQSLTTLPSMAAHKLGRRSTSYLLLGYSLPVLMDISSGTPIEYLKALSALLQEFETYQNLSGYDSTGSSLSRGRVGQMFKSGMGLGKGPGKGRRASATTDSIAMDLQNAGMHGLPSAAILNSPPDVTSPVNASGHDFQHLLTPHLPFDPDFGTTFATLCDTLAETYTNLMKLVTGPEVCSVPVGDAFVKADKAVRKILVANVMREFEDNTRAGVKGEVAGLGRLVLGGLM
jgi:hypothetical protein